MYKVAKNRKQLKSRMNALACIIDSGSLACMYSFPATEVVGQFTHIQVIILVFLSATTVLIHAWYCTASNQGVVIYDSMLLIL